MNKHVVFGLTAVGLALSLAGATAQVPARSATANRATADKIAPTRVAVVDMEAVQRSVAAAGGESLEALRARRSVELDVQRKDIRALEMKITEGSGTMTAEDRQTLLEEIRRKRDALRTAEQTVVGELSTKAQVTDEMIRSRIKAVAESLGYQLVLENRAAGVIFSAPSIDITADVVASLKAKPAK